MRYLIQVLISLSLIPVYLYLAKRISKIIKCLIILLIAVSCSDEIGPCYPLEQRCNELKAKMEQSTGAEKEQYKQKYLAEKHQLDYCLAQ